MEVSGRGDRGVWRKQFPFVPAEASKVTRSSRGPLGGRSTSRKISKGKVRCGKTNFGSFLRADLWWEGGLFLSPFSSDRWVCPSSFCTTHCESFYIIENILQILKRNCF